MEKDGKTFLGGSTVCDPMSLSHTVQLCICLGQTSKKMDKLWEEAVRKCIGKSYKSSQG